MKAIALTALVLATSACTAPFATPFSQATRNAPAGSPDEVLAQLGGPDDLNLGSEPLDFRDVDIRIVDADDPDSSEMTRLRRDALVEAANGYGAQLGFARRSYDIMQTLQSRSPELSRIFNFERIVSGAPQRVGYIVPPVVSRSFEAFESAEEGRAASAADEFLTVVAPGRIAPVVPTWRDWLVFPASDPRPPARSLNPSNRSELELFREEFRIGWEAGYEQADAELRERLDRLVRDYEGMLQYRRLVALGMMDRMVIADADFGTTVEGETMRIGDRTIRIVSDAQFQGDPTVWRPTPVSESVRDIVGSGSILAGF